MLSSDPDRQVPFLSYGFRPFFLLAGIHAVVAMAAWILWLAIHAGGGVIVRPTIGVAPHLWHGHEMIFGYAAAVIAGFMLTAVPGWTGARRVAGAPLALLAALWLVGRLVSWFSAVIDPNLVAVLDLAFLPALAATVAVSLLRRPTGRHLVFVGFLCLLTVANAAVHAEWLGWSDDSASSGLATGLTTVTLMIVVVGGRVVPSFTRSELMREGEEVRLPRNFAALDRASILSSAAVVACTAFEVSDAVAGAAALLAAATNGARLAFWRGSAMLGRPIVWSLHLGYGWVALGYAALASAHLTGWIGETAAAHILAIGAVGGMTLAIMTRASLGHTNRALVVRPATTTAYLMIAAATIMRAAGTLVLSGWYLEVMVASGFLWMTGSSLFVAVYLPILTGPPAAKSPSPQGPGRV